MILQIDPRIVQSRSFAPQGPDLPEGRSFAPATPSATTTPAILSPPAEGSEPAALVTPQAPSQEAVEEGEKKSLFRSMLGATLDFLGAPSFFRVALQSTAPGDPLASLRRGEELRRGLREIGVSEELAREPDTADMALVATDLALMKVGGPVLRFVSKPFKPLLQRTKKFVADAMQPITRRLLSTSDDRLAEIISGRVMPPSATALTPAQRETARRAGREMTEEEFEEIIGATLEVLDANKVLQQEFIDNSATRMFRKISNAIGAREIEPQMVLRVAKRFGLNTDEAAQFTRIAFQEASSTRARGMNELSKAAKAIGAKLDEINAGPASAWARLQFGTRRAAVRGVIGGVVGAGVSDDPVEGAAIGAGLGALVFSRPGIRTWRAIVTSQPATTARNAAVGGLTTTMRLFTDITENVFQAFGRTLSLGNKGKPLNLAFRDGFEQLSALHRRLGTDRKRVVKILDQLPDDVTDKLLGSPITDVSINNAAYKYLHTLNRTQEYFFRRMRFDARIHQEFRRFGIDPVDFARRGIPGLTDDLVARRTAGRQLDQEALGELRERIAEEVTEKVVRAADLATTDALEITFAAPKGGRLLRFMDENPEALLAAPFPRFILNSLDFMYKHQATGLMRFFSRETRQAILRGDQSAARIIAQATGSIPLMAAGIGIRASDRAGEKWYEIKVGNRTIDARPFNPLAAYLFLGDVWIKAADRNAAGVPLGEAIAQTIQRDFSPKEWGEAFLGIRGIERTGLIFLEVLRMDNLQGFKNQVTGFVENHLSGYTIPASAIRDIIGDEGFRESDELGIFGRAAGNLGIGEPVPSPTRETPLGIQDPVNIFGVNVTAGQLRQATGITIRQKNVIEEELDRLDLKGLAFPRGDDDIVERVTKERLGPLVVQSLSGLLQSEFYKELGDFDKKELLRDIFPTLKDAIKPVVLAEEHERIVRDLTERLSKLPTIDEAREDLARLRNNQTINKAIEAVVLGNLLQRRRQQEP